MQNTNSLISPYRGDLVDLLVDDDKRDTLLKRAFQLPKIQLSHRNVCDFELLATGGFSPLKTYLGKEDYKSVLEEMRLIDGTLFPIPITLSVNTIDEVKFDNENTLVDQFGNILGILRVEEIYESDLENEARSICGPHYLDHPLFREMQSWGKFNLSGRLTALNLPPYYDFRRFRMTPAQVRQKLLGFSKENVVAFQTRNPLHLAHEEMTRRAIEETDGVLLLQPAVGMTQVGDIEHFTRVRSYKMLLEEHFKTEDVLLSLLPLAMRMAGPKEALWHAIIRRNFGANHLIVGRDHAAPNHPSKNTAFYGEYDAQNIVQEHENEIGVRPLLFSEFVYLPKKEKYEEIDKVSKDEKFLRISGSELRNTLTGGEEIPKWFMRTETAEVLRESFPPKKKRGFCVWLTGLSGAGKSTIANILLVKLLEYGRNVTLLDGDNVRITLSKGLGFSKEDREANVRRIGFVASEIVKHNGAVICAAISPYRLIRDECRVKIGVDRFIEVFVDTPLEVCEQRDTKGLYSEARKGNIPNFTGISDPFEDPTSPEVEVKTIEIGPEEAADQIIKELSIKGFI